MEPVVIPGYIFPLGFLAAPYGMRNAYTEVSAQQDTGMRASTRQLLPFWSGYVLQAAMPVQGALQPFYPQADLYDFLQVVQTNLHI